jgi:hypothetical protein
VEPSEEMIVVEELMKLRSAHLLYQLLKARIAAHFNEV